MEKKCLVLTVFLIMLILVPSAFSLSLLNESDKGLFGATRGSDYDLILDSLFANAKVAVNTGGKLWVPWFKTSSGCAQTDLQSGANCNSGSAIDFTHNCMVSDEFSQVGIAVAMGKDQTRMDGFYNTVIASKSRNGNIPSWRIYRNGDAIEPCRSGINGNCDTASDATARIIIALYAGAKNQYFADSAKKGQYEQLARTLSADFLNYEVDRTCRPSSLGLGNICYWMAGGSEVKKAGISSNDYAYTGYFADGIIAMLQAYASTSDAKYLDVAKAFGLNYLQAANFNGNTFTVPPGKSFKWVPDSQGIPRAQCTNNCNPDTWDGFDATRAAGMCQANYYARQMGVVLPGMQKYCDLWGSKYMNDPNRAPVQYTASGSAMSYQHGYYAQGLQALFQSGGHNPSLFKPTVDSALSHFGAQSKTWDNAPCFGVYTTAFAIRALGMGIGRDLASFKSPVSSPAVPAPTAPSPIPAPTTGTNNPVIAFDDYYKINSTKSLYVNSRYLTWNDKGIDGGLKVIAVSKVSGAGFFVSWAADGTMIYKSGAGFSGIDAVNYTVSDIDGSSDMGAMVITVIGSTLPVPAPTLSPTPAPIPAPIPSPIQAPNPAPQPIVDPSPAGIASLERSCTANSIRCSVKSDVMGGSCRTIIFGTSSGDITIKGCEKENNVIELYAISSPAGIGFSACLSNGCVSNSNGFARFTLSSATATAPQPAPLPVSPILPDSPVLDPIAPIPPATSVQGVMGLGVRSNPIGTKTADILESSGCRKVAFDSGSIAAESRICQKESNRYEMYLLSPPNGLSICIGEKCVGLQSGFASFAG